MAPSPAQLANELEAASGAGADWDALRAHAATLRQGLHVTELLDDVLASDPDNPTVRVFAIFSKQHV
jgi:hypothetical protein